MTENIDEAPVVSIDAETVGAPPLAEEPEDITGSSSDADSSDGEDGGGNTDAYYEELMESDLSLLRQEFPELMHLESLTDINNPLRYAALRDLGLTPTEAYLAVRGKTARDTRSHLTGGIPKPAGAPTGGMSRQELEGARELFSGMSDTEIQKLWRRVTK